MRNKTKKWRKFFSGAGVMAICSVGAKLLGALFRIPLTNIVGAEGIGLYQMVFPLYTVLLTVSSGGLNTAISKSVAGAMAKNDEKGAVKIFKAALISLTTVGGVAALFLVLFRGRIAALQGNPMAELAYLGIAPSILFVAVISCVRGYFQGRGNMLPSGVSQLVEQLIKLVLGLYFAALFLPRGIAAAAFGAALGVTLSEFAAMAILLLQFAVYYARQRRKRVISLKRLYTMEAAELAAMPLIPEKPTSEVLKSLYRVAVPVTLGSLIMPLTQVIDSVMVINVLTARGMTSGAATSLFGLVSGPISSLVNMPVAVTLSISIALLPKIAFRKEQTGDVKAASGTVGKSFSLVLILSLPCVALFMFFSRQMVESLYSRGLTAEQLGISAALLRIESLSILYISIVQVATSVLQGADKPHRPAINLLYGAIVKVFLTLILLPVIGIKGAAIASVLCYGTICVIDLIYMKKVVLPDIRFFKSALMPLIGSALMAVSIYFSLMGLTRVLPQLYAFISAALIGAGVYGVFLLATKTVRIKELLD